ncbi:MAG: DUF2461 domain-containing protein [Bacteroidetes bacterium]|nr:DUF2461 domain-containing protein [Bacteroidota bacterium]
MNIKLVIDFLNNLRNNNNKIWFTEHKQEYLEIKNYISEITEKLINEISKFDSSIQYLTIPECTYRINRDLRFTKDKSPYKTHIGIFISPHGKKSCHAGYYFHIEEDNSCFLASGAYSLENKILNEIRNAITAEPKKFISSLNKANDFVLFDTAKLKNVPNGFPINTNYSEYLKYKTYCLYKPLTKNIIYSKGLINYIVQSFEKTFEFNSFINEAIDFYISEEKIKYI